MESQFQETKGVIRYNSELQIIEQYTGSAWILFGGGGVTVSETPPTNPIQGTLWWNSTVGTMKVFYVDEDSSQWVDAISSNLFEMSGNADGGSPNSNYGGIAPLDGGYV